MAKPKIFNYEYKDGLALLDEMCEVPLDSDFDAFGSAKQDFSPSSKRYPPVTIEKIQRDLENALAEHRRKTLEDYSALCRNPSRILARCNLLSLSFRYDLDNPEDLEGAATSIISAYLDRSEVTRGGLLGEKTAIYLLNENMHVRVLPAMVKNPEDGLYVDRYHNRIYILLCKSGFKWNNADQTVATPPRFRKRYEEVLARPDIREQLNSSNKPEIWGFTFQAYGKGGLKEGVTTIKNGVSIPLLVASGQLAWNILSGGNNTMYYDYLKVCSKRCADYRFSFESVKKKLVKSMMGYISARGVQGVSKEISSNESLLLEDPIQSCIFEKHSLYELDPGVSLGHELRDLEVGDESSLCERVTSNRGDQVDHALRADPSRQGNTELAP